MPLQAQAILESMLLEFRKENRQDHREIREEMAALAEQSVNMRVWRAKIVGIAAGVSTVISAGMALAAHVL